MEHTDMSVIWGGNDQEDIIRRDRKAVEMARKQLGAQADYRAVIKLAEQLKRTL